MRSRWLGVAVAAAMWLFALAVFPRLPEQVPTHWNLRGEVDDWMPRMPGALIAPIIGTAMLGLMLALPWIDPRRRNVEHFASDRMLITNLLMLFFALLEVLTLGAALGWPVDVSGGMMGGLGLLLVGLGNYLPRVRSNWWIGIRTPWTLDSERVWRDTHRLGGRLFVAGGLVMVASMLLPSGPREWVALPVLLVIGVVPLAYSFVLWRREAGGRP
jgi:uncharacterized membrane protein